MPLGDIPHLSIIKGDAKSLSIGAASILAKVTRDRIMKEYGKQYPEYGFEKHKGYVTKAHKEALEKYGVTPIHRKSFAPVQKVLNQQLSFDFEEKEMESNKAYRILSLLCVSLLDLGLLEIEEET